MNLSIESDSAKEMKDEERKAGEKEEQRSAYRKIVAPARAQVAFFFCDACVPQRPKFMSHRAR